SYTNLNVSDCLAFFLHRHRHPLDLHSFPTRRSSDLAIKPMLKDGRVLATADQFAARQAVFGIETALKAIADKKKQSEMPAEVKRSEEHTSELQSRENLVCRLLLEKKKTARHLANM